MGQGDRVNTRVFFPITMDDNATDYLGKTVE